MLSSSTPVLPEVDFSVTSLGITIYSPRFSEPRYIDFDFKGKCKTCKSQIADIEFFVDGNFVKLYSSRFKQPKFVFFDYPQNLPDSCQFRVRMKGSSYIIPYEKTLHQNQKKSEPKDNEQQIKSEPNDNDGIIQTSASTDSTQQQQQHKEEDIEIVVD